MKPIIKPIEFTSPLSEAEVRITLKELCGSKYDNCPFDGKVDHNSFTLFRNPKLVFARTRGIPNPILKGEFYEENEKTYVSVSMKTRFLDWVGIIMVALGTFLLGIVMLLFTLDEGAVFALLSAGIILSSGIAFFSFHFCILTIRFRKSVLEIKKALGCEE